MKVYVEDQAPMYISMFEGMGWEVVDVIEDADLVQLIGGADVTPALYGNAPHPETCSNLLTDQSSLIVFNRATRAGIPMVGICRGGQFLNVMNGGRMYQDVDRHAIGGTHECTDLTTGEVYQVTSTHHQMMIPSEIGELVGATMLSSFRKETDTEGNIIRHEGDHQDTEVVWYPGTNSLCFQPHPELVGKDHECQVWYFELIKRYFNLGGEA